jgi:hypothetical protein
MGRFEPTGATLAKVRSGASRPRKTGEAATNRQSSICSEMVSASSTSIPR